MISDPKKAFLTFFDFECGGLNRHLNFIHLRLFCFWRKNVEFFYSGKKISGFEQRTVLHRSLWWPNGCPCNYWAIYKSSNGLYRSL